MLYLLHGRNTKEQWQLKKLSVQLFKVWLCPNGRKTFSITYFFLYRASASNLSTFWEWHIFCLQHYFYFLHFQVLLVPLLLLILGVTSASSASQTSTACFPSLYPSLKVLSHPIEKLHPFSSATSNSPPVFMVVPPFPNHKCKLLLLTFCHKSPQHSSPPTPSLFFVSL